MAIYNVLSKKFIVIVSIIVISTFTVRVSESDSVIDPFTLTIAASALIHGFIVGGVLAQKHYKRENGGTISVNCHSANSVTGDIGRESSVVWVELGTNGEIVQKQKNTVAKVAFADIKNAAVSDPVRYPKIKAALTTTGALTAAGDDMAANTVFLVGSAYYKIVSIRSLNSYTESTCLGVSLPNPYIYSTTMEYLPSSIGTNPLCSCSNGQYCAKGFFDKYYVQLVTAPVPRDSTSAEFATTIAPTGTITDDVIRSEIDDYITSGGTVSIVDATDSSAMDSASLLTFPTPPTATQIANAQNIAAASSAVTAASSAVTAAANAVTVAQSNLAANPTDPVLLQKLADAQSALAAAQSEAAQSAVTQAQIQTDAVKDDIPPLATVDSSGRYASISSTISTRMSSLGSAIGGKFPFTVLTWAKSLLNQFNTGASSAPVIPFTVGGFTSEINLAVLEPLAVVTRFLSWVLFAIALAWSFKGYWHRE